MDEFWHGTGPQTTASADMAAAGYQPRQDLLSAAGKPLRILREA